MTYQIRLVLISYTALITTHTSQTTSQRLQLKDQISHSPPYWLKERVEVVICLLVGVAQPSRRATYPVREVGVWAPYYFSKAAQQDVGEVLEACRAGALEVGNVLIAYDTENVRKEALLLVLADLKGVEEVGVVEVGLGSGLRRAQANEIAWELDGWSLSCARVLVRLAAGACGVFHSYVGHVKT